MERRDLKDRVDIYGVKKCNRCGVEFPNMEKYFYVTKGTKDGLRNDCKRCHDTQKLRRERDELKEKSSSKVIIEKNKEIQELKRTVDIENKEIEGLKNIVELTDKRNEDLSDCAARLQEKHSKAKMWNCALGISLGLVAIGAGIILFI